MRKSEEKTWALNLLHQTKVFVFDFDDTLVDEQFSLIGRWNIVLSEYQATLNCDQLAECFFDIFRKQGINYKRHVDDTLERLGIDQSYKEGIVNRFLAQQSTRELVLPGATELLSLLKRKGYEVALFTNGLRSVQRQRIELAGIHGYFSYIQYGDCAGRKPDSSGFLHLSRQLNLADVSELTMIGNSLDEDYYGARAIGARCILVDPRMGKGSPVTAVSNLEELYSRFAEVLDKEKDQWLEF